MSRIIEFPDEIYSAIESYAAHCQQTAEAVILAWGAEIQRQVGAEYQDDRQEIDLWAGLRGAFPSRLDGSARRVRHTRAVMGQTEALSVDTSVWAEPLLRITTNHAAHAAMEAFNSDQHFSQAGFVRVP